VNDEVLHLLPIGISQALNTTKVDGIGLYERGIELVLTDDLAEAVTDTRTANARISIRRLGRKSFSFSIPSDWASERSDLFH
jgi:hypothetical protein